MNSPFSFDVFFEDEEPSEIVVAEAQSDFFEDERPEIPRLDMHRWQRCCLQCTTLSGLFQASAADASTTDTSTNARC